MKNINEEEFVKVANSSSSMSEAAAKLNMRFSTFKRYALKFNCYNPNQSGKGLHKKPNNEYDLNDILNGLYPGYQSYKLKNKLVKAGLKENKCECCGITEWNGKEVKFELHHIDGDSSNNSLSNLQILCPNCHSQTANFRSKKRK